MEIHATGVRACGECANEGPAVYLFSPENTIIQTKTIVCNLSTFLYLQIVLGMAIFMAVLAIIQADPEPRSHYGYRSRYGQVRGYAGRYQGRNNRGYGKIQPYGSSYGGYGKKRPSVPPMAPMAMPMAMPMAPPSPKVRINYVLDLLGDFETLWCNIS